MKSNASMFAILLLFAGMAYGADAPEGGAAPGELDGLVAWYRGQSLHEKTRDGETVARWVDASGNGHDLAEISGGMPSVFRTRKVNGRPVVEVGKQSSFSVAEPFELGDHTIFLVYAANGTMRALFSSDRNDQTGIILRDEGLFDQVQSGLSKARYAQAELEPDEFQITTLTGQQGRLDAYINGAQVAAAGHYAGKLRVGRFFHLRLSTAVVNDGAGLSIAEMIFYDRSLEPTDRRVVEEYLAQLYDMPLAEVPPPPPPPKRWSANTATVHLETGGTGNLNDDTVVIDWDKTVRIAAPFRQDPEFPSRLYCDEDMRVRIGVELAMRTEVNGARVRVAILKNRETYIDEEGETPLSVGKDEAMLAWLDAELVMRAGDFIEVVTLRDGAAGEAVSVPGKTKLLVKKAPPGKPTASRP